MCCHINWSRHAEHYIPGLTPHPLQLFKPPRQGFSLLMAFHHNCITQALDSPLSAPQATCPHLISNQVLPVLPLEGPRNCPRLCLCYLCSRLGPHHISPGLPASECVLLTSTPPCPTAHAPIKTLVTSSIKQPSF